ncbi:MAG: hypothetical protein U0836_27280 [Pirellulales bacterium]
MGKLTALLAAFLVVFLSAALALGIGTAVTDLLSPAGRTKFSGLQNLQLSALVGGLPAAAIGVGLGYRSYRRNRHSDEALSRQIVCLLTALLGFAVGTTLLAPLVLSIDAVDRFSGGMLFGGIPGSLVGYRWGRNRFRYEAPPPRGRAG